MTLTVDESYAWCRRLARRTGRNFYFSFLTLPRVRFRDMCALYAFMRVADDLGDDVQIPLETRRKNLAAWRSQLEAALDADEYRHELFPALVQVVRRYEIPRQYLAAVIDGVETDLSPVRFATFDELAHYCYHVAGAVGLCCIYVWGFRGEAAIDRAIDCGLAFQLTNILRDLGEDAAMDRVYLPREDLERFGFSEADLKAQVRDEQFTELMRFQVDRAREFYERAVNLFDDLEPPGRPILSAMLKIYGGLLAEIERRDFDVFSRRVTLPKWRKVWYAASSVARYRWLRDDKRPAAFASLGGSRR